MDFFPSLWRSYASPHNKVMGQKGEACGEERSERLWRLQWRRDVFVSGRKGRCEGRKKDDNKWLLRPCTWLFLCPLRNSSKNWKSLLITFG